MESMTAKEDLCEKCKKKRAEVGVNSIEGSKVVSEQYCNPCWIKIKQPKKKK